MCDWLSDGLLLSHLSTCLWAVLSNLALLLMLSGLSAGLTTLLTRRLLFCASIWKVRTSPQLSTNPANLPGNSLLRGNLCTGSRYNTFPKTGNTIIQKCLGVLLSSLQVESCNLCKCLLIYYGHRKHTSLPDTMPIMGLLSYSSIFEIVL